MKCQISVSAPNRKHPEPVVRGVFWIGFYFKRKRSTTVLIFHPQFSILNFIYSK